MVEDREMCAALEPALGAPVRVLDREPSPYASSFPLERLVVQVAGGRPETVMWKDLSPGALLPDARRARVNRSNGRSREPDAYNLLAGAHLGTPRRIAAVRQPERTWLFLEAVDGARLEHVGELARWQEVARWLAAAHRVLAACAADATWLPRWEPPGVEALTTTNGRRLRALEPTIAAASARLAAAPAAVVHGELFASNVLVRPDGAVCVVDWETIAHGPALLDLAALTAGRWDEPGDPLAESYRRALPDAPALREFREELDAARLVLAAERLRAPTTWTPPPEQARDWLADAELIARRAEL